MIRVTLTQDVLPAEFEPAGFDGLLEAGLRNVLGNFHASMEISDVIPRDTGILAQSIPATIDVAESVGTIGTPLLYGLVMEKGRKPGKMPPVEALEKWVRRKLKPKPPKLKIAKRTRVARAERRKDEEEGRLDKARREARFNPRQAGRVRRLERRVARAAERIDKVKSRTSAMRRESYTRGVAFAVARSIARNGIAVPLKFDGRGKMFERTHEATVGRFAGWFLEPFLARRTG